MLSPVVVRGIPALRSRATYPTGRYFRPGGGETLGKCQSVKWQTQTNPTNLSMENLP